MFTSKEVMVIVREAGGLALGLQQDVITPPTSHLSHAFLPLDNTPTATVNLTTPMTPACFPAPQHNVNYYLKGVVSVAVIVLGVLGNAMAMIVLTRPTMKTSTNLFLAALAVWDTVVLLGALLLVSLSELSGEFRDQAWAYVVVYVYPLALAAQTAGVCITVAFTVERYIAVCHPLRAASMCTIPRARCVVLIVSVASVMYNIPRWFEYRIDPITNNAGNQSCVLFNLNSIGKKTVYHRIYYGWAYTVFMLFIPLCALAVLNSLLVIAVQRSKRQRKDMNVRQSRENNVTVMLMSVVFVFIICQVPALIYNIAYAVDMEGVRTSDNWIIFSDFRNFLVPLNSAVNFILYCGLGQKFRRTFVRTFCRSCMGRDMMGRFQSFSFNGNRPRQDSNAGKTPLNGVGLGVRDTEAGEDDFNLDMDMKVLRSSRDSRMSRGSQGSRGSEESRSDEVNSLFDTRKNNLSIRYLIKNRTPC